MVVSALQSDIDSDIGLKDTSLHLPVDNTGAGSLPYACMCSVKILSYVVPSRIIAALQENA